MLNLEDIQEEFCQHLFSGLPGMFYRFRNDREGHFIAVSLGSLDLTGYSSQEITSGTPLSMNDLVLPADLNGALGRERQGIRKGQSQKLEYRIICRQGRVKWITDIFHGLFDEKGDLYAFEGFQADITEKKNYQEIVQTLQAYQNAVNEAAIVSITDKSGVIQYTNDNFLRISQYSRAELKGQTHRLINSGYHPPEFFKDLWDTILSAKPWRGEMRNRARDGTYYWVDTVITPLLDAQGGIVQFLSIRNLITDKKISEEKLLQAHEALEKKEQQLNEAQWVSNTGSWYLDISNNVLSWSDFTYQLFGLPPGSPVDYQMFLEKVHPEDRAFVAASWEKALQTGKYDIEHRILGAQGEHWVRERAQLEFDSQGKLKGAVGTVQDISSRKIAEVALRESEEKYRELFNNSPIPVGILEKKTLRFIEVNQTAVDTYGYSREEFRHLTGFDLRVEEDRPLLARQLEKDTYIRDRSIRKHLRKDGKIIYVEPSITQIKYNHEDVLLIAISDITANTELQEQLFHEKIHQQKELTQASLQAQERERKEIGEELHDNVNQLLASARLCLEIAGSDPVKNAEFSKKSMTLISSAIEEIRKLSRTLVPPSLGPQGLRESLEILLSDIPQDKNRKFSLRVQNLEESRLGGELKLALYRITQEQVSNILKHAHAHRIRIDLSMEQAQLTLRIEDDGLGFDLDRKRKGIGLVNIINRAETYGGIVSIETAPGKGCTLQVRFILPEATNPSA